jgi:serine/threonine-protein kinase
MGEVYRARDTRLNRNVAIKSLPATFAHDPERVARFKREAQLVAALNHPHIAGIYGLEEFDGSQFLVLELVEGGTLADRLARGPLEFPEALRIAKEVIDALEAAHDKGIVHRDLKPGNIALTADGQVKVLDFGLARFEAGEFGSSIELTNSPTLAFAGTQAGVILGTAAYMSPEQAKGRTVDKRSDVWAFGCVFFEMLTGRKAFEGEDVSDTLASILRAEPDWTALPPSVPPAVRTLIKRCLDKDRRSRIPDLSVVRFMMTDGWSTEPQAAVSTTPVGAAPVQPRAGRLLPWLVCAALVLLLGGVLAFWVPWSKAPTPAPVRVSAEIGAKASIFGLGASMALSPDGQMLAMTAQPELTDPPRIYVRRLDQLQATMLSGTEGAAAPFFSPDGQWIGFFAGGKMKKVAVAGGAAVTLCDAGNARGGSWADDGTIVFQPENTPGAELKRVSAAGGTPSTLLPIAEGETLQRWPQMLPGSKAVLYTSLGQNTGTFETADVVVRSLADGQRKVLVAGGYFARYVRSGHVLYSHEGTLFALPFNLDRLEVTGPSVPVIESVLSSNNNGAAQLTVSDTGTAAYISGATASNAAPVVWLDQTGKTTPLRSTLADWASPSFSPDGSRLAMDISDGSQVDVWVYDWARDTLSRLTFDKADDVRPSWTPDGRRIIFASKRGDKGVQDVYWQRADGTGDAQQLTDGPNLKYGGSMHPSGKWLAYTEQRPGSGADVMILPLQGDEATGWKPGTATAFLSAPYTEGSPQFSPDGRWIAYISNESGRNEIYVRPFPGPGGKWQISNGAADDPTWSTKKKELIFASGDDLRIMKASYSVDGDSFKADKPEPWSAATFAGRPRAPSRDLDLHPDGQRLAIAPGQTTVNARVDKVVLIFNFFDELTRLTAGKK